MNNWGIVGGGILGMTLAHRLASAGQKVTILEAGPTPGGLLKSCRLGEVEWDSFYHVILKSDLHLRELLNEVGLEKEIEWVETKTGFYSNSKLYSMSNIMEYLKFPPLSLLDKFRLGLTIFYASKEKNWRRLEEIPIDKWLTRWSGKNTYNKIWAPLLRSKLGENYKHSSAAFIWATIQRMYAARKSGLKKEMFGYVPGSYRRIILALLDKLYSENIEIKTNYPVNMIHKNGDSTIHVESPDGLKDEFDKVILTIPSAYVSQICPQISEEEKLRHNNIKYLGVICVSVLLKKSLANYYITNITDDNIPFTGVIEMSALVNKKQFGGNALIYLPKYLSSDDKDFGLSKEVIEQRFLNTLLKMYPHITKDDILATNTAKARYVFALPTLGYSQKLPPITSSLPGLYIINTSHIVNGTLNVNETINLADVSLENIFAKNVDMNSTYRAPEHIQV